MPSKISKGKDGQKDRDGDSGDFDYFTTKSKGLRGSGGLAFFIVPA